MLEIGTEYDIEYIKSKLEIKKGDENERAKKVTVNV